MFNAGRLYKALCCRFKVSRDELLGNVQDRRVVIPRQVGMTIARELGHSYAGAAWFFNRTDHTTAIQACKRTRERMKDPEFARTVEQCREWAE